MLCTLDKTFQIRQIQTSNTVFLTRPTLCSTEGEITVPGITAISSVPSYLELTPTASSSALPYLLKLVAPWPGRNVIEGRRERAADDGKDLTTLFNSIPLSHAECIEAYEELVIFQFEGAYHRPTAKQLQQAWQETLTALLTEDINTAYGSVPCLSGILQPLEQAGWPEELVKAILGRLGSGTIEEKKALNFVGTITLEAETSGGKSIPTDHFLEKWRNAVPEQWRGSVNLGKIDVCASVTILR